MALPVGSLSSSSAVEAFGAGAFDSQLFTLGTGPGKPAAGSAVTAGVNGSSLSPPQVPGV